MLRAFLDGDGRLREIPTSNQKKLVVLDHIAQRFEVGERYPEARVNEVLKGFHRDHAALRRHLVDFDFLARDEGFYWRSGGTT